MSPRLTAKDLAEMNRRFQKMGGVPSKALTQSELQEMERRFREIERNAALRTFRATGGRRV